LPFIAAAGFLYCSGNFIAKKPLHVRGVSVIVLVNFVFRLEPLAVEPRGVKRQLPSAPLL
jgi:hypothetical protein